MKRSVEPELLDELPPADPRAVRSRQDLLRVNAWMGNGNTMTRALRSTCDGRAPRRIVELGAGDGRLLLRVARRLAASGQGASAVLLDRLKVVSPATCRSFEAFGWQVQTVEADARDWLEQSYAHPGFVAQVSQPAVSPTSKSAGAFLPSRVWKPAIWQVWKPALQRPSEPELDGLPTTPAWDVMVANLFLHHFQDAELARLLRAAARLARVFIAVEPRRSVATLFFSRLLWFIGCNQVTRHDARVSVRAGFTESELCRLWPTGEGWALEEHPAGWFSHLFIAQRKE